MKHDFWSERWAARQIGFHLPQANPRLVAHLAHLGAPGRVLVPLCGKSLDMAYLAAQGFAVEGVEFVQSAAEAFFDEAGVTPQRQTVHGTLCLHHGSIRIWVADILELSARAFVPVDAIYDRAALVALEPSTRGDYVSKLVQLSGLGASLLLVTFEHDSGDGPPFSVEASEVRALFGNHFALSLIERVDVREESPKLRDRTTRVHESVWSGRPADS